MAAGFVVARSSPLLASFFQCWPTGACATSLRRIVGSDVFLLSACRTGAHTHSPGLRFDRMLGRSGLVRRMGQRFASIGWTPDTSSPPGLHEGSSGRRTYPMPKVCFVVVFSRLRVDARWGGFPKNRPRRWRYCALRPPAYVFGRKGTGKQWVRVFAQFRSVIASSEKPSPPSYPVNCLPLVFRTALAPIRIPVRTLGSTSKSISKPFVPSRARLSRVYPICSLIFEMCKALRCTPENCLTRRFFLTGSWRSR